MQDLSKLPCFPCPHRAACCRWGTWLNTEEGFALNKQFGIRYVFLDQDTGDWRTQVHNGRCMFFDDRLGCILHGHKHYPTMCRDFPAKDTRNPKLPMAYDAATCPEVKKVVKCH